MAWYNPFTWFGGNNNTRRQGYQSTAPATYETSAAANVDSDSAMTVSAWWACVKLLTETVSTMPIEAFTTNQDGSKERNYDNQIWRTLNYQPNRYQDRVEFFETLMFNLVTDGNAYIKLTRNSRGISEFLPLMSSQMQVRLNPNGSITYRYTDFNSETTEYTSRDIWHIKLFGNGIVGMSPLAYARQSLGVALATDKRTTEIAKTGGKTTGALSFDTVLTSEQRSDIHQHIEDRKLQKE